MITVPNIGTPTQAITFALTIDDHYNMREFLAAWSEGDIGEWPEFRAHCLADRPFRAGYRADSKAEVRDLFGAMRGLAVSDAIPATVAVHALGLMHPRGAAGKTRMLRHLYRLDPSAFLPLWSQTCHHVLHGQDSEDAHSVGGWSQREIDLFIGAMAAVDLAQPAPAGTEPSDPEIA